MKSMKNVFICSHDPVLSTVLGLYLSREHGIQSQPLSLRSELTVEDLPGSKDDPVILDTDCFEDPAAVHPVLRALASTGRRVAALCSIPDPDFVPRYENILRLDKPFGLEEVGQWVSRNNSGCPATRGKKSNFPARSMWIAHGPPFR